MAARVPLADALAGVESAVPGRPVRDTASQTYAKRQPAAVLSIIARTNGRNGFLEMAIRPILRLGHPVLRQIAAPVTEFDTPSLRELVHDMVETMRANDGAGLAAIQIGVLQRVVVFELTTNPRYPEAEPVPLTVLVNPEIEFLGDEREAGWEGCLSVPGMRGLVPRYRRLRYGGFDELGRRIDRTVEGFHARVVQHECDHLDGILYPQRIEDMTAFGFQDELVASGVLPLAAALAD
jgi:peptide deformylase